jgi:myosin heavy subunit
MFTRAFFSRIGAFSHALFLFQQKKRYCNLPIYTDDHIRKYAEVGFQRLPPHVFATASRAYRSLKATNANQSIVVSGESGAGKTETCKQIMRFMASVCGDGGIGKVDELERRVLGASPILEVRVHALLLHCAPPHSPF